MHANQAGATGRDPQRVWSLRIDGPDSIAAERSKGRILHEAAVVETVEPPVRTHQHVAIVIFRDGANPAVREAFVEIVVLKMRAVPAAESAGCANPQILISIFEEPLNAVVAQPFGHREPCGFPIGEAHHALTAAAE